MNVNDVMCREPRAVRMVDRLDAAARVMWDRDCGFVPVVDGAELLVGVLTDRDLCMAAYTQGRTLAEIPVLAVMSRQVAVCRPDDPLSAALATMARTQVHRLPVVDARGVLVGVLSASDLVRLARSRPAACDGGKVLEVLATITAPRGTAGAAGERGAANQAAANPIRGATAAAEAAAAPAAKSLPAAKAAPAAKQAPAAKAVEPSRPRKRKA